MVRLWETNSGRLVTTLDGHSAGVWGVALSADGRIVASGGGEGTLHVWESSTGRELARLQGHTAVVWRLALPADGQLLASGGGDGTLRLWETSTGRQLGPLRGHAGGVLGVALTTERTPAQELLVDSLLGRFGTVFADQSGVARACY
jgi:WD40 repeat protein